MMKADVWVKCALTTALCAVCLLGCDQMKPKVEGTPGATGDHHIYLLLSFDRKTGIKSVFTGEIGKMNKATVDWDAFGKSLDEASKPFGELHYCERAKEKTDYCRGPKLFCKCVRAY